MNVAFADTFYFLALVNPRDQHHRNVAAFSARYAGTIVTSDWVMLELADALASPLQRGKLGSVFEFVASTPDLELVRASAFDFDEGVSLYRRRPDKEWSLTDCISFEIMRRLAIADAITGDRHFAQAGFNILL